MDKFRDQHQEGFLANLLRELLHLYQVLDLREVRYRQHMAAGFLQIPDIRQGHHRLRFLFG